jgi:DNA-binding NtrC family response regulator
MTAQNKKVISWIEDDADVIGAVVKPLREKFDIKEYPTYTKAIKNIDEICKSELVLLDLLLPPGEMNVGGDLLGAQFLDELDKRKDCPPVIVFSVIVNGDKAKSRLQGKKSVVEKLRKPILPSELKQKVYRALNMT